MGPVRGTKKRRKTEKTHDNNNGSGSASGSSEKEGLVDWWDELSKKINGIFLGFVDASLFAMMNVLVFNFISILQILGFVPFVIEIL
ncbi:hypothetical protein MtrunA17_Chr2g0327841 [Medicago truncatula]|uniref:Transmembrane protein, putative n=1 Tax=Medicago truncatula TaxID=3880 RepID=A0A072VCV7_MEDTR|nr:transmembrane protein, putative [Medicago truncatula]RHN76050.1 hypothetical protein MtrunA17_Chr2g0327841 [Medicago truncatula]